MRQMQRFNFDDARPAPSQRLYFTTDVLNDFLSLPLPSVRPSVRPTVLGPSVRSRFLLVSHFSLSDCDILYTFNFK